MSDNQSIHKKNKPPYLLGLLCLMPLLGALVGIALILYGIFKYKDKWLVIIGSAGVLITITIYSLLFYNLKYGRAEAEGFAKLSQLELNDLGNNIELYKIANGTYPYRLEQLLKYDGMTIINDPLLLRKMDNNIKTTFEYQKVGNKYTLFSVGIDGLPHTPDDLYPKIFIVDSSRSGFIKSN